MVLDRSPLIASTAARSFLGSSTKRCCSEDFDSLALAGTEEPGKGLVAHVGSASFPTALCNLVLAVLGAGALTLPYAFSQLGLYFGLLSLFLFTLLSAHSLHTLSIHELHFTPQPTYCLESYAELVVRVLGRPGSVLCSILLALYAWGGALSFLVILKGELSYLSGVVAGSATGASGSFLMFVVAGVFIWPLSSLEDLSGLKKFSPIGCACAIFITFVVLMCTRWTDEAPLWTVPCEGPRDSYWEQDKSDSLQMWPSSFMSVAASLPLLSFALNSSWAYIPIFCTMYEKSNLRVRGLVAGANLIIVGNYALLAIYGYVMFCGRTAPNILESLGAAIQPHSSGGKLVLLARAALAVQLSLALPMRFFVARRTIAGDAPGTIGRVLLSGVLVGSATALAALPLSLATVLGIVSSICASMIIYILPAIVDLRVQLPGRFRKACSVLSLAVGAFVLLAGLYANVTGVAVGS